MFCVVENEQIHINEIAAQARTKNELYTLLSVSCGVALPKRKHVNTKFLADIFSGRHK